MSFPKTFISPLPACLPRNEIGREPFRIFTRQNHNFLLHGLWTIVTPCLLPLLPTTKRPPPLLLLLFDTWKRKRYV